MKSLSVQWTEVSGKVTRVLIGVFLLIVMCSIIPAHAQENNESRKIAEIDPQTYDVFLGQYQLAPEFIVTITKENNQLFAQATGQSKNEIFPESDTKFFYKVVNAQITFKKDENGKVTELTLHQNGRDLPAKKISDNVPEPNIGINVDAEILDSYVGKYEIAPNVILSITKENNLMYAQVTGQSKVEIFPESDTKFFYKVVNAQITFVKDDKGVVTELILHQNGDHRSKKIE
ncbi:DUF3471 domain-containing protein [Candidatus Latescibacterota bacterium]